MVSQNKNDQKRYKEQRQILQRGDRYNRAINYRSGNTLKLINRIDECYVENDKDFIKSIKKLMKPKQNKSLKSYFKNLDFQLTTKQYEELHHIAKIHGSASKLNQNSHLHEQSIDQTDMCPCGCGQSKGLGISFFVNDQKLKVLGPGVLLQLLFQKATFVILLIPIIFFSIFAIITNYIGGQAILSDTCKSDLYCSFIQYSSNQNKSFTGPYHLIQNELGLIFCILWIISLRVISYIGAQKDKIINTQLHTASDYAIKVQNLPRGTYEQQQLISHLEGIWQNRLRNYFKQNYGQKQKHIYEQNILQNRVYRLNFKSVQIVYNMQFVRKMIDEILQLAQQINSYYETDEQDRTIVRRIKKYRQTKYKLISTYERLEDVRKRFIHDRSFRKVISTTCCIIQFDSIKKKNVVLKLIGQQKMDVCKSIFVQMKNFLGMTQKATLFHEHVLKIQSAPQPSDLLWENCEKPESLPRRIGLVFVIFMVMLAVSGVIFGLTYFQQWAQSRLTNYSSTILTIVNLLFGLALQIISTLLWWISSNLLDLQYHHTQTQKIAALLRVTLFLNIINVIVLPCLTNYVIYGVDGLNGNNGLVGIVFDYHISGIISAIKGLFDIMAILKFLAIKMRWSRKIFIWFYLKNEQKIDFKKGSKILNQKYQGIEYDIAQNYMNIIIAVLHASFFCQLQPFILIIVLCMTIIFYFVNRIKLFYICKKPALTQYLVFDTSVWMLGLVPIFYGTGTILLSFWQSKQNPNFLFSKEIYIPAAICIAVGILSTFVLDSLIAKIVYNICRKINENVEDTQAQEVNQGDFISKQQQSQQNSQNIDSRNNLTQIDNKEKKSTRIESYYAQSNSLKLFGFENVLKQDELEQACNQLKGYCQSFFTKQVSFEDPIDSQPRNKITRQQFNEFQQDDKAIQSVTRHQLKRQQQKGLNSSQPGVERFESTEIMIRSTNQKPY